MPSLPSPPPASSQGVPWLPRNLPASPIVIVIGLAVQLPPAALLPLKDLVGAPMAVSSPPFKPLDPAALAVLTSLRSPAMDLFRSSRCRMDASTRLLAGEHRPAPGAARSRHACSIPDIQRPNPVGLLRGIEQQQFGQRRTSPLPRPSTSPWTAELSQLGEDPPVPFPHARLGLVAGTVIVLLSILAGKHRWISMAKARAFLSMFK